MPKYLIDATVTLRVEKVTVRSDEPITDLVAGQMLLEKLERQLVLLDILGSRSGDDGFATGIEIDSLDAVYDD